MARCCSRRCDCAAIAREEARLAALRSWCRSRYPNRTRACCPCYAARMAEIRRDLALAGHTVRESCKAREAVDARSQLPRHSSRLALSRYRHSAAKLRRDAGESIEDVSRFLDHSSLAVTTTYLRGLEGRRQELGEGGRGNRNIGPVTEWGSLGPF